MHQLILLNIYLFQIVSEFERILGVTTSIRDIFVANLRQTSSAIISVAKRKTTKNSRKMQQYLQLLEDNDLDDEELSSSEG